MDLSVDRQELISSMVDFVYQRNYRENTLNLCMWEEFRKKAKIQTWTAKELMTIYNERIAAHVVGEPNLPSERVNYFRRYHPSNQLQDDGRIELSEKIDYIFFNDLRSLLRCTNKAENQCHLVPVNFSMSAGGGSSSASHLSPLIANAPQSTPVFNLLSKGVGSKSRTTPELYRFSSSVERAQVIRNAKRKKRLVKRTKPALFDNNNSSTN